MYTPENVRYFVDVLNAVIAGLNEGDVEGSAFALECFISGFKIDIARFAWEWTDWRLKNAGQM